MKPLVLAKNIEFIPAPSMDGCCISATETSTLGNPPTTLDADCKLNNPVKFPNIPNTPSTPLKTASPANPITPRITSDNSAS